MSFLQFTQINDAVAATRKKLQKQAVLARYFQGMGDDDLPLAVRFCGGLPFPMTDERTLGVGGAIIGDVVLPIVQIDSHEFYELARRHGEIGDALATVWPQHGIHDRLQLRNLAAVFDELAATGNVQAKKSILRELFLRCSSGREAAYLTKIIFGDLRTGVQEGVLQAAVAQAFNKPLPQIQHCQLLLGDLDEVALLARRDALMSARFRLFHPIQFMLATPQESAVIASQTIAGRTFFAEDKLDGIRAQIHKSGNRIAIYTRSMDRIDHSFPDVTESIAKLDGEFLLDGEIVPYRDGQVLPFAHIQKRRGRKLISRRMLQENPAGFVAFDLLYRDGQLLMDQPLHSRRRQLVDLAASKMMTTAVTPVTTAVDIEAAFDRSRQRRNEGLVLKDFDAPYLPGKRGQMWLKIKTHLPTFDCVVTAAEFGHGKRRNTLSDYTFAVWDREPTKEGAQLVNIGKAYSGVTDEEITQLTEFFLKTSRGTTGWGHRVEPKVVLEIACDQIQKSMRHSSGYALRFPRIKRVRWDKAPGDADQLSRIIEIYQSTHNFGRGPEPHEPRAEPTLFD